MAPLPAPPHPVGSRALRAGLAAAAAVAVALLAHRAGHGTVDVSGAAWAFVALAAPAWWMTGRERGWGVLALSQWAGQQAAHLALTAASAAGAHAALPMDLMVYTHLVAAGLTATWLRWGERRAWSAAGRGRYRIARLLTHLLEPAPEPARPPARGRVEPAVESPGRLVLRHALARRGPPLPA